MNDTINRVPADFESKEIPLPDQQENMQRNMHVVCSDVLNGMKAQIMNIIESIGLPEKQEDAIKTLVKHELNVRYQQIDRANREYVQTVYKIIKEENLGAKYLQIEISGDQVIPKEKLEPATGTWIGTDPRKGKNIC